jgi:hypothetical protein
LDLSGFVLLNMGVVLIKNSLTCKTRLIGKQTYSQKIRLITTALLNDPLTKPLPVNTRIIGLVAMLAPAEHDRATTLAL